MRTLRGRRIAVTGATGFLGRYIVDALLSRGAQVIGVVRNPDRVPALRDKGVDLRRADLGEPEALLRSFTGAEAVVSNAAMVSFSPRSWRETVRTNVEGTENVFRAAAKAGVARAVQISSTSTYRGHQPPVDESHPQHDAETSPTRWNAYGLSKALSETRARTLSEELGIGLTALRPPGIFGAFDTTFTRVHKRFMHVRPVTLYPSLMRLCLVYAGDVAEAVALSLEKDAAVGAAYNVAGEDRTTFEFARAWQRQDPKAARFVIPVPFPHRRIYSTEKLRRELGWAPRSYEDAIREVLASEAKES
ncbi:MAG: NAD(P)-dependent oxidoreductase [Proteobacteria bacterium]|nr:NAD(P)-dependent oxidoreductase [Pseudomonadota bacterium]